MRTALAIAVSMMMAVSAPAFAGPTVTCSGAYGNITAAEIRWQGRVTGYSYQGQPVGIVPSSGLTFRTATGSTITLDRVPTRGGSVRVDYDGTVNGRGYASGDFPCH